MAGKKETKEGKKARFESISRARLRNIQRLENINKLKGVDLINYEIGEIDNKIDCCEYDLKKSPNNKMILNKLKFLNDDKNKLLEKLDNLAITGTKEAQDGIDLEEK
jgi:hypothetical protein